MSINFFNQMKVIKKYWLYTLVFIVFFVVTFAFIYDRTQRNEKKYKIRQIKELQIACSAIIHCNSKVAATIYNEIIKQPGVINIFKNAYMADNNTQSAIRDSLYKVLSSVYTRCKQTNFVELHFILPDNTSFLRFHCPEKYGDNIGIKRSSIKIANAEKQPVQGFEIGCIYHGYRYVYPLSYENKHIGVVEIGVPLDDIIRQISKIMPGTFDVILKKEIVFNNILDNSALNNDTSVLNNNYLDYTFESEAIVPDNRISSAKIKSINNDIRPIVYHKLNEDLSFAVQSGTGSRTFIIMFSPLQNYNNEILGYIISYSNDITIRQYYAYFYIEMSILALLYFIILYFIYYLTYSRKKFKNTMEQLQIITDNIYEGIIFLNSEFKIISINQSAEKILEVYNHEVKDLKIDHLLDFTDSDNQSIDLEQWPLFKSLDYGFDFSCNEDFYVIGQNKRLPVELIARTCYHDALISGYLIIFHLRNEDRDSQLE